MDEEELRKGDLPPTFYCYGTEDPFYGQFEDQYELMQDMGAEVSRIVLEDWPHGFWRRRRMGRRLRSMAGTDL